MIFQKLCEILADQLGIDPNDIRPETNIVEDLGADSLDVVELITTMEDEFDIIVTDEHIRELYTVGEVAEFMEKLIEK